MKKFAVLLSAKRKYSAKKCRKGFFITSMNLYSRVNRMTCGLFWEKEKVKNYATTPG